MFRRKASNGGPSKEDVQAEAARMAGGFVADAAKKPYSKLLLCIVIDLIGCSSYLLPVVGEAGDIAWAPIEAYLLLQLFGSGAIASFGFIEEALPGFDIIPTACIAWSIENVKGLEGIKKLLFPSTTV